MIELGNGAIIQMREEVKEQISEMLDCLFNERLIDEFSFITERKAVMEDILIVLKPYVRSYK